MRWRRLLRVLHRDVGYFLFGLVTIYAISGIAVNHIDAWNPSYSISVTEIDLGPLEATGIDALESEIVAKAGVDPAEVTGRHRPAPGTFVVFLPEGGHVKVNTRTGEGSLKRVASRTVLFEFNVLHLNHLKGVWTYVADAFSVLLLGLAASGLFMLKGRTGLNGRGKWFVAAGLLLPVAFLIVYYLGPSR